MLCVSSWLLVVMKVPMLMDDWTHIHIHSELSADQTKQLTAVLAEFQTDLKTLSADIDERNKTRRKPFESFNPKFLESSISV